MESEGRLSHDVFPYYFVADSAKEEHTLINIQGMETYHKSVYS